MSVFPNWLARRPHVAELDFAGVVVDVNGTEFKEHDEVFGMVPIRKTESPGCALRAGI